MNRSASALLDDAPLRALLSELREQARAFRFEVAPNPTVGAAVFAGTRELGRGFHPYWGGPHAEINALADEPLSCVLVRSDQEPVVVNLDIPAVEAPEEVRWIDPIHR